MPQPGHIQSATRHEPGAPAMQFFPEAHAQFESFPTRQPFTFRLNPQNTPHNTPQVTMKRRDWLLATGASLGAWTATAQPTPQPIPQPIVQPRANGTPSTGATPTNGGAGQRPGTVPISWHAQARERLAAIERASGARLGVALLETGSGALLGWREHERFALCSTFKLLLAAWALARVDQGQTQLTQRLHYTPAEVLPYSPISAVHAGAAGMTVAELCAATVSWSDNTAANVLLRHLGGPAALTDFLRAQGDAFTRLDRCEPELNQVAGDDVRDTTTPLAMLRSVQHLVLGPALSPDTRPFLQHWLRDCRTGDQRIRAGAPGWTVGDKTGTGERMSHDVAVLWPPGPQTTQTAQTAQRVQTSGSGPTSPLVMTCYLAQAPGSLAERDAVIATVTRTLLEARQAIKG